MIFIQHHLRRKCSRFRPCSHPNRLIDNLGMVLMVVQGQCFHSIGQLIPCMWSHYQSNQHQYSSRQYRHFYPFCHQLLSRFFEFFHGKLNANDKCCWLCVEGCRLLILKLTSFPVIKAVLLGSLIGQVVASSFAHVSFLLK